MLSQIFMELKEFLNLVRREKFVFFGLWATVVCLALFTLYVQPKQYQVESSFVLGRQQVKNEKVSSDEGEKYDYYYQLEANKRLVEMMINLLSDESFQEKVFSGQIKSIPGREKKFIIKHWRGKKGGAGYFRVYVIGHNLEQTGLVAEAIRKEFKKFIGDINSKQNNFIVLKSGKPVAQEKSKPYLLTMLISFLFGLLVSLVFVLLKDYLRENVKSDVNKK